MTNKIRRWTSWLLLTAIFAIGCWFLSQWQFSRADDVRRANQLISENYDQSPVPLESLLPNNQSWNPAVEYRQVTAIGRYLTNYSYLVRNRPLDGNPGFLQLVAFQTTNGQVIFIERGWLPTGSTQDIPDSIPQVFPFPHEVTFRLRPTEPADGKAAPAGQLSNINIASAAIGISPYALYTQAYGRLVSEKPELARGTDLGKPTLSEGNHFSYALQWIVFGLMAIGAVSWNIDQDRRRIKGLPPRRVQFLTRDKDGEVEDQILEK